MAIHDAPGLMLTDKLKEVTMYFIKRAIPWLPVLLLLAACGGLAGEPQIIATLPPPTPAPTSFPVSAPDLALGARIYAENCTRCHGVSGRGDGPLVGTGEGQIDPPPPDFTDPVTTGSQTPLNWYHTITNGRIQNLMPPWKDALSEEERWAVAMYTWAMHYQPDWIASGQAQWSAQAQAAPELPPQSELVNLTDDALLSTASGAAGITNFVSSLNVTDRQALAAYLRTSTLTNVDVIGKPLAEIAQGATPQPPSATILPGQPAATPETTAEATAAESAVGTISGQVSNGTAGGSVPPGLTMTLRIFDLTTGGENIIETRETPVNADGTYAFSDVPLQIGHAYDVFTFYQDRSFGNSVIPDNLSNTALDLPITLYELTDDPSVIRISGMVTQIVVANGSLQIAQVYSFTNTSDRVFTSQDKLGNNSVGDPRYASVHVSVPQGAQLLGFADTQSRYTVSGDGRTVTDTALVLPGEGHILHLLYTLPYTGELQIEQPVSYAVEGPVRLLVTPGTVAINSPQLPSIGPQTLRNVTYQGYGNNLSLAPNEVIRYELRGLPTSSGETGAPNVVSGGTLVAVVLVGIGAIIIAIGLYIFLRGRASVPVPVQTGGTRGERSLIDGLIQQIAELDEAYAAGQLDETTHQKRRKRLKTRLAELMDKE